MKKAQCGFGERSDNKKICKEIIVNINSLFFSYRVFEKKGFDDIIYVEERSDINEFNCRYCRTT